MKQTAPALLTSLILFLTCAGNASTLQEGLIAFYPFTHDFKDASGGSRDLQSSAVPQIPDRFGRLNAACLFDGTRSSLIADLKEPALGLNTKFTVSCWAKVATFNPNGSSLIRKDGEIGFNILNYETPNRLAIEAFKNGRQYRGFTVTPPAGQWCMLTATWDGSSFAIYINAVAQAVSQDSISRQLPVYPITVGSSVPFPEQTFNGALDEVRIYDRVLAAEEITSLYALQEGIQSIATGAWYETKSPVGGILAAGEMKVFLFEDFTCSAVRQFNDLAFDQGQGSWTKAKSGAITVKFTSNFAGENFSGTLKKSLMNGNFRGGGYTGKFFVSQLPPSP